MKKLYKLLIQANHDIEHKTIEIINMVFHHYQIKSEAPQRFELILKKDIYFNYEIIVDVMY